MCGALVAMWQHWEWQTLKEGGIVNPMVGAVLNNYFSFRGPWDFCSGNLVWDGSRKT
jgi:hypothetical protein